MKSAVTVPAASADVDFQQLAERYKVSGGDIRNAVLKAALAAAAEPGPDSQKRIAQRHLDEGMREVLAGKRVMRQSLFEPGAPPPGWLQAAAHMRRATQAALLVSVLGLLAALAALTLGLSTR